MKQPTSQPPLLTLPLLPSIATQIADDQGAASELGEEEIQDGGRVQGPLAPVRLPLIPPPPPPPASPLPTQPPLRPVSLPLPLPSDTRMRSPKVQVNTLLRS